MLEHLNGNSYLRFLRDDLVKLLENVPLVVRRQLISDTTDLLLITAVPFGNISMKGFRIHGLFVEVQ